MKIFRLLNPALLIILYACQPVSSTKPVLSATLPLQIATLIPYKTSTPAPLASSGAESPEVLVPSPSATPRSHTVKKGEDMGGIAFLYGITLSQLIEANPDVNPNILSVGTNLVIPVAPEGSAGSNPTNLTPTPAAALLGMPNCAATLDQGLECLVLVSNPLDGYLESVSVTLRLANPENGEITSQNGTTPLNLIGPKQAQAIRFLLTAPVPAHYQVGTQLISAFPYNFSDQRYLSGTISQQTFRLADDRQSGMVEGEFTLDGSSDTRVGSVWIVATAYDAGGQVVGYRRWQSPDPVNGGQPVHFSLLIYSINQPIDHLDIQAEARP